jgi:glycosyltransferase involved in cell wall biosynthesis
MKINDTATQLKLILVEPRGQGGMIHYAYQMCNALSDQGVDVTLITSTQYELTNLPHHFKVIKLLNLWDTAKSNKLTTNRLSMVVNKLYRLFRRAFRGIRYIIEWFRLARYLAAADSDIIQFGKIEFSFETFFLRWLKRKGKTLTQVCHEYELRERSSSLVANYSNNLYYDVYNHFSLFFFHAEDNLKRFQAIFGYEDKPMIVIPMGNEEIFLQAGENEEVKNVLRSTYGISKETPTVLFFGLLAPSKGIPDLIEAYSFVHKSYPESRLIIAGAQSKYVNLANYKDLVHKLSLDNVIIFDTRYIPIEEVGSLFSLANFLVYPYITSTQSASLQVAYSFGKPVIVTDIGGLPEAVENGKSGLVVPQGNLQEMANAILNMLNNPARTEKMGAYAKHLSETRFSWKNIASKIITAYSDLIHPNSIKGSY